MAKGPIDFTETTVAPLVRAKWCMFAGRLPLAPAFIGLVFATSSVSPMPTRKVPFLTRRYCWFVVQRGEDDVDVCMSDPGHPVTIKATATLRTMVAVLMGDTRWADALRERLVRVEGDRELARRFESLFWFREGPRSYAGLPPSATDVAVLNA
jgi:hypothetical protein